MTSVFPRRRSFLQAHARRVTGAVCLADTARVCRTPPIDSRVHPKDAAHLRPHIRIIELLAPRLFTTHPRSLKLQ